MINENWNRWITASINKYFDLNKGVYQLYLESQVPDVSKSVWAELKIMGPNINQLTPKNYKIYIEINVTCSAVIDLDFYKLSKIVGKFQNIMLPIPVKKYGDGDAQISCLTLRRDVINDVETLNWGQISPDKKIELATVQAFYETELTGD